MDQLLSEIRACTFCENLPFGHRPIIQASANSKILIVGQAPGRKVHESGIPWNDASGKNLRKWLCVTEKQFYNPDLFALVPMGFCFPGTGMSGDLPPRPECAPKWHNKVLNAIPSIQLTLLFGQYAQRHYLGSSLKATLTETVKNYKEYLPDFLPLPHPSPRNGIWLKKNEWFEKDVLPTLRKITAEVIST